MIPYFNSERKLKIGEDRNEKALKWKSARVGILRVKLEGRLSLVLDGVWGTFNSICNMRQECERPGV
jgi:hypothetical protein